MLTETFKTLPRITGELVEISPIVVHQTDECRALLSALATFTEDARNLANKLDTSFECDLADRARENLKRLRKDIESSLDRSGAELVEAQKSLDSIRNRLDTPISEAMAALFTEMTRYKEVAGRAQREREERERLAEEAGKARNKRLEDVMLLRKAIASARQAADDAESLGEVQTAKEIRSGIQKYHALDSNPDSIQHPREDAVAVRGLVASALQHEQERRKGDT